MKKHDNIDRLESQIAEFIGMLITGVEPSDDQAANALVDLSGVLLDVARNMRQISQDIRIIRDQFVPFEVTNLVDDGK